VGELAAYGLITRVPGLPRFLSRFAPFLGGALTIDHHTLLSSFSSHSPSFQMVCVFWRG